jgi:hypothetical protein
MWPFTRSKKIKNGTVERKPTTPEPACEETESADEDVERKARRDAAQKRIVETLREAQEARNATICIEAEHVKTTQERRQKAETTLRRAQEQASEVSGVFDPEKVAEATREPEAAG